MQDPQNGVIKDTGTGEDNTNASTAKAKTRGALLGGLRSGALEKAVAKMEEDLEKAGEPELKTSDTSEAESSAKAPTAKGQVIGEAEVREQMKDLKGDEVAEKVQGGGDEKGGKVETKVAALGINLSLALPALATSQASPTEPISPGIVLPPFAATDVTSPRLIEGNSEGNLTARRRGSGRVRGMRKRAGSRRSQTSNISAFTDTPSYANQEPIAARGVQPQESDLFLTPRRKESFNQANFEQPTEEALHLDGITTVEESSCPTESQPLSPTEISLMDVRASFAEPDLETTQDTEQPTSKQPCKSSAPQLDASLIQNTTFENQSLPESSPMDGSFTTLSHLIANGSMDFIQTSVSEAKQGMIILPHFGDNQTSDCAVPQYTGIPAGQWVTDSFPQPNQSVQPTNTTTSLPKLGQKGKAISPPKHSYWDGSASGGVVVKIGNNHSRSPTYAFDRKQSPPRKGKKHPRDHDRALSAVTQAPAQRRRPAAKADTNLGHQKQGPLHSLKAKASRTTSRSHSYVADSYPEAEDEPDPFLAALKNTLRQNRERFSAHLQARSPEDDYSQEYSQENSRVDLRVQRRLKRDRMGPRIASVDRQPTHSTLPPIHKGTLRQECVDAYTKSHIPTANGVGYGSVRM